MANISFLQTKFNLINEYYELEQMCDQLTGELLTLEELSQLDSCLFYVDNLNFLYIYVINELIKQGYKSTTEKTPKRHEFSFAYNAGNCANLTFKNDLGIITLVNFKNKFGVEFGSLEENVELLEYAHERGRNKNSLGADAYAEFLLTIFRPKADPNANAKLMREDFVELPFIPELEEAKLNCAGFQYAEQGEYYNLYNYDIISSYPAQLTCDTPTGAPKLFESLEDVPASYFKIIKFTYADKELEPNKFDFVASGKFGTITLTEHLFKLFLNTYKTSFIKILKIWAFKTVKGRFNKFINRNIIEGKIGTKNKRIAKYNKFIANSLTGYFGRRTTSYKSFINNKLQVEQVEHEIPPVYLPVYLFVTGKAKAEFLNTLNNNYANVVYANTDGFFAREPIALERLNWDKFQELGSYKLDEVYKHIYIDGVNAYSALTAQGAIDNCISGMTVNDLNNVEQFKNKQFVYTINVASGGKIKQVTATQLD